MKLSAKDLLNLKVIDEIISEPIGGAHRDKDLILKNVKDSIKKNLDEFNSMNQQEIFNHRKNKFLLIGRNNGFINQSADNQNLILKENLLDKINIEFNKNKPIILGIIITLIAFSFYFFFIKHHSNA